MPESAARPLDAPDHDFSGSQRSRPTRAATWALCIGLAVLFAAAGSAKLLGAAQIVERFDSWGYSESFRVFIGLCEITAALGLLWPRLVLSACAGLGGILIGAVYTHLAHGESAVLASGALLWVVAVGWLRRGDAFFTRPRIVWQPQRRVTAPALRR